MGVLANISNVTKDSRYTATELLFAHFNLQILNLCDIFVTKFFIIIPKSIKKDWISPVRKFLTYYSFFNIHNFVDYMPLHLL